MYLKSFEIIELRVLELNHPDLHPENGRIALNSFRSSWVRLGPAGSGWVRLGPAGPAKSGSPGPGVPAVKSG